MPLEEEVVIQRLSQGTNKEDMISFVEALESTGLKIDREKISTALHRQALLRKASLCEKDKGRIIEKILEDVKKEYIEELMKNPKISAVKFYSSGSSRNSCDICKTELDRYYAKYTKVVENKGICVKVNLERRAFDFCDNCGKYYPKQIEE